MSMKNKTLLCAAVAAAMSMPSAFAAGPVIGDSKIVQPSASAQQAGARLIVKYREGTLERSSNSAKTRVIQSAAARSGASAKAARSGGVSATHLRQLGVGADLLRLSQKMDSSALNALVREISADPSVEYAQVDTRDYALVGPRRTTDAQPQFTPNDPFYAQYQWNFTNPVGGVNASAAWDVSSGEGIVVAVIDTGILPTHPDMNAGQLLDGYDFITDAFVSRRPTDERVPGALDYGDWNPEAGECYAGSPVSGSSWHGTHVAGTVAQSTNNALGAAGLAYNAKVLPLRALGRCGGYGSDIADAIVWASGGSVPGLPANENPAEVINLSLGGGSACDATYQDAIDIATANGSLVVVAAGNSNSNVANFRPASCNNVVAVGASRITGGRASYSNFGPLVDLAAPGGGGGQDTGNDGWDGYILQAGSNAETTPDSGTFSYVGYTGTSMASPHVAAVAALVQSALSAADRDPLTPAALEALLKSTARPFPTTIPSNTPIGTGIVDPVAALSLALEEPCDPEVEECAPPATPLANATPVRALSGTAGGETLYSIDVPAGVSGPLSVTTSGGSGDVSLHVSLDEAPGETGTWNSTRPGNSETIRINAPAAGTYYIKLKGVRAYSNVTLQARFSQPPV
ncbi:Extracellular protease [Luteimonas sp. 9C]|uniref:S8 family peptidase n=1 Tax=Luteimonas sp. 9C TaxID=2653148 RepID=UPI0012F394BA|nr:S8 family peptidase [Luteimonas sp. 9C]VXC00326.1 Extracellular protease [Luteimonas sp. 9C]